jgi:putative endonuclease
LEVKTRRSRKFGYPEEAITRKKRTRLIKAALLYLEEKLLQNVDWRFDLIAIECHPKGEVARLEHLEDVIQGESGEFF